MGILDTLNPLNLVTKIGEVADRFIRTGDDKDRFNLEVMSLVQARDSEIEQTHRQEMQSKERVIVADLQQGDSYTKRARPTVVYAGLVILVINHIILPWVAHFMGQEIPSIDVPQMFWAGWSGIVMTWSIGRDRTRQGLQSKMTEYIVGK